jgi:hypothetical protein
VAHGRLRAHIGRRGERHSEKQIEDYDAVAVDRVRREFLVRARRISWWIRELKHFTVSRVCLHRDFLL